MAGRQADLGGGFGPAAYTSEELAAGFKRVGAGLGVLALSVGLVAAVALFLTGGAAALTAALSSDFASLGGTAAVFHGAAVAAAVAGWLVGLGLLIEGFLA